MTIWKFQFEIGDIVRIDMPVGAKVLHVESQHGVPCMWALVDPHSPTQARDFRIFGTGHHIDSSMLELLTHVATFQQGSFVWHLFE